MRKESSFELIAAPFTPLDNEQRVRYKDIVPMARHLANIGVSGAFICGTTGEGMSLTLDERKRLAEAWKEACHETLECIVHVGHCSVEDSRDLARHAAALNADGISAIGPCFYTPNSASILADYLQSIAEAAPSTPFFYYHMPSMAHVPFAAFTIMELLADQVPSFSGIKFTHNDIADFQKCMAASSHRWKISFGRDEMLLDGIKSGAQSAVGSTYNFAAPLYQRLYSAYANGDLRDAEHLQKLATAAINVMIAAGGLPAIKATMGLFDLDCGSMRLPLRSLKSGEVEVLRHELEKLDFFEAVEGCRHGTLLSK